MLSVIIPTCNRPDLLRRCLEKLAPFTQTLPNDQYEVIVSDDSTNASTEMMIRESFTGVTWYKGPRTGPAANRNNGARYSQGAWIIFFDDDCLPDPNILLIYKTAQEKYNDIRVFEGCIKADRKQESLIEESPVNETGGFLWSCNFMISKQVFQDIGGFDEKFPYASMEDVDLHYRLRKLGIATKFLKEAIVIHPWRIQNRLIPITINRFKSTLYYLKKHPETKKDINSFYYLRAFYGLFFKTTLSKAVEYKFNGFLPKVANDFIHLYFAVHLFFYNKKLF